MYDKNGCMERERDGWVNAQNDWYVATFVIKMLHYFTIIVRCMLRKIAHGDKNQHALLHNNRLHADKTSIC